MNKVLGTLSSSWSNFGISSPYQKIKLPFDFRKWVVVGSRKPPFDGRIVPMYYWIKNISQGYTWISIIRSMIRPLLLNFVKILCTTEQPLSWMNGCKRLLRLKRASKHILSSFTSAWLHTIFLSSCALATYSHLLGEMHIGVMGLGGNGKLTW